jgi:hypothetical protein
LLQQAAYPVELPCFRLVSNHPPPIF